MANRDEHRMVFDIRGRRKNVVKVVYAILAILMGASLFLAVGPLSISDLFSGNSGSSSNSVLNDQADAIDKKLIKDPKNENLLLSLVRTRYSAGNNAVVIDSSTGQQQITTEAADEYSQAADAWSRYLETTPADPNPQVAQLAANAIFTLAQTSTSGAEASANLSDAAAAQAIVAKSRPNVGTLSTYAYYSFLAGDFKNGDRAAKQAAAAAPKSQRKTLAKQIATYRKQGQSFQAQLATLLKAGQGKPGQSDNPLGGLSGGGLGTSPSAP